MEKLESFLVNRDTHLKQAMRQMKDIGAKILFVVNEQNRLYGALSDGDIRRWILSEGRLDQPVEDVCNMSPKFVHEDYHIEKIKQLMLESKIESVPVVDKVGSIKEVLVWDSVFSGKLPQRREKLSAQIVIMAGGKGARLDPFTRILPKPLIPIGNKPIIEIIMDKFSEYGISEFFVTINHKSKIIKSYFEEANSEYKICYVEEEQPLGTAGSLRLLRDKLKSPVIISNCDIIVESDYAEMARFHKEHNNDLTLIVSLKHYVIPYGVCEIENGGKLKQIKEKPEYDLLVNTGMYILNKEVIDLIPANEEYKFTDLVAKAKDSGLKVGVFPIDDGSWIDIGQWEEYRKVINKINYE